MHITKTQNKMKTTKLKIATLIGISILTFACKKSANTTSGTTNTGGNNNNNTSTTLFQMAGTSYTVGSCYVQSNNSNQITLRQNILPATAGLSALITFRDSVMVRTYNTTLVSSVLNISSCKQSTIYIHDSLNNKYLYPDDGGTMALSYPNNKWKMVFTNVKFSSSQGSADSVRVTGTFLQN